MTRTPITDAAPFLAHGERLTALRMRELMDMMRRTPPGTYIFLRRTRNELHAHATRARMEEVLGPGFRVERRGYDIHIRARVSGEPLPQRVDALLNDADVTGQWLTLRAAARRVGVTTEWFRDRYMHSGLVPAHRIGRVTYVHREAVERARTMRAGGAVFAADWPDTVDEWYEPYDPADGVRRSVDAARERLGDRMEG